MPQDCARRAVIRADASVAIGAGHVMRCLTLADALRNAGFDVTFISRPDPGNALDLIRQRGFRAQALPSAPGDWEADAADVLEALASDSPVDWLIVDHYGLDQRWESRLRRAARNILVIDDLADRPHDCDALLDQNYYVGADQRYRARVPARCRLFLGPEFALLRDEFRAAARAPRPRDGTVGRLLVTFGATDPTDETGKVLTALQALANPALAVDVVVGAGNPRRAQIEALCARLPGVRCHVQTARMADLMRAADLAVGAGGATTWERCVLGLPALTVVTAENQLQTTTDLAAAGAIWYLGRAEALAATDYAAALREAMRSPARLRELSARATAIMAPAAAALATGHHPVVDAMIEIAQEA